MTTGTIDLTSFDSDDEQDNMEEDHHMHDPADLPVRPERQASPEDDLEDLPLVRRLPAQHARGGIATASQATNSMFGASQQARRQPRSEASNGSVQTILDAFPTAKSAQKQQNAGMQSETKPAAQEQPQRGVTSLGLASAAVRPAAKAATGFGRQDISRLWPDEGSW